MGRRNRGKWIKLYYELFDREKFLEYNAALREGRRTRAQRRAADDAAMANVMRLYLALGQTDGGRIEYSSLGARMILERWMDLEGDELLAELDRMAKHGIINRELWATANVVTTTNAVEQAAMRTGFKDRSDNANAAKRSK